MSITRQPIQLGNHQRGASDLAEVESLGELGPIIVVLAALDLHEFTQQLPSTAVQELLDGGTLRFEPETAFALPLGGNPQVGNELAVVLGQPAAAASAIDPTAGFPNRTEWQPPDSSLLTRHSE